ncbi:28S ribosomal protein S14, mitochondrial isoform X1 [Falco naumanni]|uniref:28S ribosomal protein S14, mitochondrial isoform X1 n=1 Tax=Falco naumanni TaxID=148594 RepID=UPI001ADE5F1B|nr:28S ribosomal protein S14, mitochondrial isoform X1 [Falco naumanni]
MAASALGWALRAARQVSAAPSRPCSPQGPAKALGERVLPLPRTWQVRSYYVDWRMLRDVKRRKLAYEYADERLRINAIRKNTILPKELQEVADKEIANLPRDSCPVRIRNRCVLTSRPRGVKRRWRLSRIVFRHFADHAQMSGIQRAMW